MLFFICITLSQNCTPSNKKVTQSKIDLADKDFIALSSKAYNSSSLINNQNKMTIDSLYGKVISLQKSKKEIISIQYIISNLDLIQKNIDHKSIFKFILILLSNNEWNTSNKLLKNIVNVGDKSLISNVKFIFAQYYFEKGDYTKSKEMLTNITSDLSVDNGHYASIMNGIILQKLKRHRESLVFYDKVPSDSPHYGHAQLNKAIVYIRQGWWADAHIIIRKLFNQVKIKNKSNLSPEFINRLYLVVGYSFLQQEYFRESRENFRSIHTQSGYANRAMLGIALSAANQGDNVGALNILNILQEQNKKDLAIEETYLLLPYIYERIGQHKTASASYSIALSYYKKRISEIKNIVSGIKHLEQTNFKINNNSLTIKENNVNISDKKTLNLLKNLKKLRLFQLNTKNKTLLLEINSQINANQSLLTEIISKKLVKRINFLESYQNQAQYGIARLYDNSRKK